MELITSQIDKIEELLTRMDEIVDSASSAPFSAKARVDKEALFSVIDDIRAVVFDMRKGLPHELNQAKRLLSDKENHMLDARSKADGLLNDARSRAEMTIKAAEAQAARLVDEHEITIMAKHAATEIEDAAKKEVGDFKLSAAQYVDGIFRDLDDMLREVLEKQITKARETEDFYNDVLNDLRESRQDIPLE